MSRPLLTLLRRRLPRWLAPVLVLMLLGQQLAVAAHLCALPVPLAVQSAGCGADMGDGDGDAPMAPDCAAHCADPVQHAQDALALGVPPLPLPAVALPRTLLAAANAPPGRDDADPAALAWRQAHAATVLLI